MKKEEMQQYIGNYIRIKVKTIYGDLYNYTGTIKKIIGNFQEGIVIFNDRFKGECRFNCKNIMTIEESE